MVYTEEQQHAIDTFREDYLKGIRKTCLLYTSSTKQVCLARSQRIHLEFGIPSAIVLATRGEQRSEIPLQISEGILISPSPVSYTHLDVYKRQVYT